MQQKEYVLVTPARNEEAYIRQTIEAVLAQTILPQRWVIVSDASVDRTDEIVAAYAQKYGFIQLLRAGELGRQRQKDFGSKVNAFKAGYEQLSGIPYQFVGNLDADITFGARYYEQILERFQANPLLGLAGGIVLEPIGARFVPQHTSLNSVCGSVHLFRRESYEAFGGYIPISVGGIDAAAEIMVRMHGWEVQTFPDIHVYAQRRVSTGGANMLHTRFRQGVSYHLLGYHPIFQLASSISRLLDRPYVVGSIFTLLGYAWSFLRGAKRVMPAEVVRFLRAEQMARVTSLFSAHKTI